MVVDGDGDVEDVVEDDKPSTALRSFNPAVRWRATFSVREVLASSFFVHCSFLLGYNIAFTE